MYLLSSLRFHLYSYWHSEKPTVHCLPSTEGLNMQEEHLEKKHVLCIKGPCWIQTYWSYLALRQQRELLSQSVTGIKAFDLISTQCHFYFMLFCRGSPQTSCPGKIQNFITWKIIIPIHLSVHTLASGAKQSESNSDPDGLLFRWNKSGCSWTEATVWGATVQCLCKAYSPPVGSSSPQTSFLGGTVVMRRISSATRLKPVCICTDSLMDYLQTPPGDVYVV